MRWAHLAGVAIGMRLAIFPVTARFLIPRAAKRVDSQMMRTHPEPIDDTSLRADYGELRASSRLPTMDRGVELVPRIGVPRIGKAKGYGISFSNLLKGLLSRKAGSPWRRRFRCCSSTISMGARRPRPCRS